MLNQINTPITKKQYPQIVILDENFNFKESNDAIFTTENLKSIPVKNWFPFIESIYTTLQELNLNDDDVEFSKVESPSEFLPGNYDFLFRKIEIQNQRYLLWYIYDYTKVYSYLTKYQQLKNELDIHRQTLEHRLKKVKAIEDLFDTED